MKMSREILHSISRPVHADTGLYTVFHLRIYAGTGEYTQYFLSMQAQGTMWYEETPPTWQTRVLGGHQGNQL